MAAMHYQCVRIYRFQHGSLGEVIASARQQLIPKLETQPGFVRYQLVTTADDRAVSTSVWETDAAAATADLVEADWVRASISHHLAGLPELLIGPVVVDTGAVI